MSRVFFVFSFALVLLALVLPWSGVCGLVPPSPEVLLLVNGREYHTARQPVDIAVQRGKVVLVEMEAYYQGKKINPREFTYQWCFTPAVNGNVYCEVDDHSTESNSDYTPETLQRQELDILIHHDRLAALTIPVVFMPEVPPPPVLMVDDFQCDRATNNLGGDRGTAVSPPTGLVDELPKEEARGCVAKIKWNLGPDKWGGFFEKLQGQDISSYEKVTLFARVDSVEPVPFSFKLELKRNDNQEWGMCRRSGEIDSSWRQLVCQLEEFVPVQGAIWPLDNMSELLIVFEEEHSGSNGEIYIDDIRFE